jgi:Uncharacterized alpha/beta hydrolase domain (DUF2235)
VEYVGVWDTVFAGLGMSTWPGVSTLPNGRRLRHAVSIDERRPPFREVRVVPREGFEEVWFAGVHSDVGGTFPDCRLATIALKWVFEPVCTEVDLRDGQPEVVFAKYCTVDAPFATAQPHDNGAAWRLLGAHERRIPPGAVVHETVKLRRQTHRNYRPDLADLDVQWTNGDWLGSPPFGAAPPASGSALAQT